MSQYPPYDPQPQGGYYQQPPTDQGGKLKPPAICLIVVGGLSILFFLLSCVGNVMTLMNGGSRTNAFTDQPQTEGEIVMAIIVTIAILAANLAVILGAVQMLKQRGYGLALTAAIISVIPCVSPCCVLGIPFGIWALVVLMNDDVKAAFR